MPRFAAPGASDVASCLSLDDPCSIATAVSGAGNGDEVIVAPGDYPVAATMMVGAPNVTIHGTEGQPRPVLHGSPAGPLIDLQGAGASLRRLRIHREGGATPALQALLTATLTDLEIVNDEPEGLAAARLGAGVTLSTSTVRADGRAIVAVGPGGPILTNVTAWSTGGGIAIHATGLLANVQVANTIARAPGGDALVAENPPGFTVTTSNVDGPEPLLANPGAGDFHQLPGSPTINAGVVNPLAGLTDIDGDQRVVGLAPDIGADEYVPRPPAVATGDPVSVTTTGGRLTGSVDPNGRATTYRFEYGPTPVYGSSTPTQDAGSGDGDVSVGADIGDLAPGSVVHYRLVATNADGETAGLDRVLIALPAPEIPVVPGVPTPPDVPGAPQFTNLTIPTNVTVGQPFTVRATGSDSDDPVNSIVIDFDDGPGFFAQSACRLRPPSRVFSDNRRTNFSVPYSFTTPGTHTVEVTLGSGNCGRPGKTTTQTIQVDVQPATARSRAAVTIAADCRDADLLPSARNTKRIEKATVCLLNQQRRAKGLKSFRVNKRLRKAASIHNRYMVRGKFLAHQGPGEPGLARRLRMAKYRGGAGENIGVGAGTPYATPRGMVQGWMGSPVHQANVLERAFFTVGIHVIAQKPIDPTLPGATYTAEFGTTRR